MPRIALWVVATAFVIWEHVALFLWVRAAGGLGPALAHAWGALRADWLVLLLLSDAGMFTICTLVWLWRDLCRRDTSIRTRTLWFGTAVLLGSPSFLVYLATRQEPTAA